MNKNFINTITIQNNNNIDIANINTNNNYSINNNNNNMSNIDSLANAPSTRWKIEYNRSFLFY